ncbi:GTpase-activating protein GYP7 [Physcia stellaris]|nr:GTpase-activating protein GYP7 [Physcia stellaris]
METPLGLMAQAGMSPRPTEAPGLNGIPQELVRRQNVQYPPPPNWCGFVGGDYSNVLSCSVTNTCVHSGGFVGCSGVSGVGIWTTCVGYDDKCDAACSANDRIIQCEPLTPYCALYSYPGSSYQHVCQEQSQYGLVSSIENLEDYYLTAIGSTLTNAIPSVAATAITGGATSEPSSSRSSFGFSSGSSTSSSPSSSTGYGNDNSGSTGLAAAAIGGIAAGVGLVFCAVVGFFIWCCLRRRKRARIAASQNMTQHAPPTFVSPAPAPIQQQQQLQPNYQPVPQQDTPYHGSGQFQPTQAGYFGGPSDGKDSNAYTHVSPVGSPSPSKVEPITRPFSVVSSQHPTDGGTQPQRLSPPVPGYAGPMAGGQNYNQSPVSPTATEVDGTQGNPGVPHGYGQGINEVDGTQGNPGVPYTQQGYRGPYEMH